MSSLALVAANERRSSLSYVSSMSRVPFASFDSTGLFFFRAPLPPSPPTGLRSRPDKLLRRGEEVGGQWTSAAPDSDGRGKSQEAAGTVPREADFEERIREQLTKPSAQNMHTKWDEHEGLCVSHSMSHSKHANNLIHHFIFLTFLQLQRSLNSLYIQE